MLNKKTNKAKINKNILTLIKMKTKLMLTKNKKLKSLTMNNKKKTNFVILFNYFQKKILKFFLIFFNLFIK
jgi:hypothetical protein